MSSMDAPTLIMFINDTEKKIRLENSKLSNQKKLIEFIKKKIERSKNQSSQKAREVLTSLVEEFSQELESIERTIKEYTVLNKELNKHYQAKKDEHRKGLEI